MPQLLSRKSGNTFKYSMAITYFMRAPTVSIIGAHRGLKVVVHVLNKFGAGQKKWSTYLFIISGRGRKSGGAIALVALARWAPLGIFVFRISHTSSQICLYSTDWDRQSENPALKVMQFNISLDFEKEHYEWNGHILTDFRWTLLHSLYSANGTLYVM